MHLTQDLRINNNMAVIRIDDPRSGSEGYTFDIEWSGALGRTLTGFSTGTNYPPTSGITSTTGGTGTPFSSCPTTQAIFSPRAIDLCSAEVRMRAERDYNLRNIDINPVAVDGNACWGDWVTVTFTDRTFRLRRAGGNRSNRAMFYTLNQVCGVEMLRADGSALQPGTTVPSVLYNQTGYDQNCVFRACQDAVVARAGRDGYRNLSFTSIAVDTKRSGCLSGVVSPTRGPVSDPFDFGCSMDFAAVTVRNLELNRRPHEEPANQVTAKVRS